MKLNPEQQLLCYSIAVERLGSLALLPQNHESPTKEELEVWKSQAFEVKNAIINLIACTQRWAEDCIEQNKKAEDTTDEAGVNTE